MNDKPKREPSPFERFEDFTRRLLRVPKTNIAGKLAAERRERERKRKRRVAR